MTGKLWTTLALIPSLASCGDSSGPREVPTGTSKSDFKLVLVLTVDQFRGDYLDRFEPVFRGGFDRLKKNGVRFLDAHQDHAMTTTAAGHASISTGTYPSRSGVITNQWFDRQRRTSMYCVEDVRWPLIGSINAASGRSPNNLQVSALPDWLKEHWPNSRAFTGSYKDRAAILLGGHQADSAYWYSGGDFVTSSYYQTSYPQWVREFNARKLPDQYFGKLWKPFPVDTDVKKDLAIVDTDFGWFSAEFPHALGGRILRPDDSFYASFAHTPMVDEYLVHFVKELILQEQIGLQNSPDYLGLSFSALDLVGHTYGINSPELLDTLIRLDVNLGDLLDFIDFHIGLDRTLIVFSSDHGASPMPEYRQASHLSGRRADYLDTVCWQNQLSEISSRLGVEANWLLTDYYLDYEVIDGLGLDREAVEKVAADVLEDCLLIRRIWTRSELLSESDDPFHHLFRNSFHPDRSPNLMPQLEEYQVSTGSGSSHGTPYRYDTHVPILFMLPGVEPARIEGRVGTIDIAPTLAEILGLEIPAHVQGKSLANKLAGQAGKIPD